jgi:hypothetical protein
MGHVGMTWPMIDSVFSLCFLPVCFLTSRESISSLFHRKSTFTIHTTHTGYSGSV